MKLVILSCAFEDYLNTEFLLYVWGSEPFRYIVLSVIGENGTWDPPASPIPSSSCSVTLLLGNLKGSIPQGRWEQSAQHPVPSVCLGSAGHCSFQHRHSCVASLCVFSAVICGPSLPYVLKQCSYCPPECLSPAKRLLVSDGWCWSARAASGCSFAPAVQGEMSWLSLPA